MISLFYTNNIYEGFCLKSQQALIYYNSRPFLTIFSKK